METLNVKLAHRLRILIQCRKTFESAGVFQLVKRVVFQADAGVRRDVSVPFQLDLQCLLPFRRHSRSHVYPVMNPKSM